VAPFEGENRMAVQKKEYSQEQVAKKEPKKNPLRSRLGSLYASVMGGSAYYGAQYVDDQKKVKE